MTDWDYRQRLDRLIADLKDTIAAVQQSRVGNQIVICVFCGAPTVNGNCCTKCERETPPCSNPS